MTARVLRARAPGWSPEPELAGLGKLLALAPWERVVAVSGPTADGWYSGHRLGDPNDAGWFSMHYVDEVQDEGQDGDETESEGDDVYQEDEDTIVAADRTATILEQYHRVNWGGEAAIMPPSPQPFALPPSSSPRPQPKLSCELHRSPAVGFGFSVDSRMTVSAVSAGGPAALAGVSVGMRLLALQGIGLDSEASRAAAKAQLRAAPRVRALFQGEAHNAAASSVLAAGATKATDHDSETESDASVDDDVDVTSFATAPWGRELEAMTARSATTAVSATTAMSFVTAASKQIGMPPSLPAVIAPASLLPATPARAAAAMPGAYMSGPSSERRTPSSRARRPRQPGQTVQLTPSAHEKLRGSSDSLPAARFDKSEGSLRGITTEEQQQLVSNFAQHVTAEQEGTPPPSQLPPAVQSAGWRVEISRSTGLSYYYNAFTGASQFEVPTVVDGRHDSHLDSDRQQVLPASKAVAGDVVSKLEPPEPEPEPEPETEVARGGDGKVQTTSEATERPRRRSKSSGCCASRPSNRQAKVGRSATRASGGVDRPVRSLPREWGWKEQRDSSGVPYWEDSILGRRQCDRPTLPAGWKDAVSRTTGDTYFVNGVSGETTYDKPAVAANASTVSMASATAGSV